MLNKENIFKRETTPKNGSKSVNKINYFYN